MSLSALDKIKLKTQQILVKADDYVREQDSFGNTGTKLGMMFAMTGVMVGVLGVATIVAAPALPAIAAIASVAAAPTALSIGGASINLAGASLLAGGGGGIIFAGISKMYSAIRGTQNNYVRGEFECILRDKNVNPSIENDTVFNFVDLNNVVKVDRKTILKSIENGTFHDKYIGIRINGAEPKNTGHEFAYHKIPTGMRLEDAAGIPFKNGPTEINVTNKEWKEDCQIVRRECFKEAKSFSLKANILNRINTFRETVDGHRSTAKFNV